MDQENLSQGSVFTKIDVPQSSASNNLHDNVGEFNGVHYKIDRRDRNALLWITLQSNVSLNAQAGAMLAMTPNVTIKRKFDFSFKEILTGSEVTQTTYTGPGEVLLALPSWGDIIPIRLDGSAGWYIDRDDFLAMTDGVTKEIQLQNLSKGIYSEEKSSVDRVSGVGLIFVKSSCAIIQRQLNQGEQWIVNNGHLVAWNCSYTFERIDINSMSGIYNNESLVCKFTGPGTVFISVNKKKIS